VGLGLEGVQGDLLDACARALAQGPTLLLVDNCEHLLAPVAAAVEVLLGACPRLRVLATSREPLRLPGEHVHRLPPLALPGPGQDPSSTAAVALLQERAARVRPDAVVGSVDVELAAEVVRRLDGMPLAIELAAGRLSTFTLADLAARVDRALDLLETRSGDPRHRTLRATVAWSYGLLGEDEQRLFRHLSVFPDGCDLATAEQVARRMGIGSDAGSVLARLVDASMVEADLGPSARYRMLETLRAFGLDRLHAAGEAAAAEELLRDWAVDFARWFRTTATSAQEPRADEALRRELATLRAAWSSVRRHGDVDRAAGLVSDLFDVVGYRDLVELRTWAEELADDPALAGHPAQAAVLGVAAESAYHAGDHARATTYAETGLAVAEESDAHGRWTCLTTLSVLALARQDFTAAVELSLQAHAVASGPRENLGIAALASAYAGQLERATELSDRGARGATSPTMLAWAAYVRGEILTAGGDRTAAGPHYTEAIELARRSGARFVEGVAAVGLQGSLAEAGQLDDALRGYREVVEYFARTGNWPHLGEALRNLARLLDSLDDPAGAELWEADGDTRRGLDVARRALETRLGSPR